MVKDIRISDYDYPLPEGRIALHPCLPRDACRLLVRHSDGTLSHERFTKLPELLPAGSMMICNNTRVINARLRFQKTTGATVEIFCLEPHAPRDYAQAFGAAGSCQWTVLVGNLKRWKEGNLSMSLTLADGTKATLNATNIGEAPGNGRIVEFSWLPAELPFATIIEAAGVIPIPPYLNRDTQDCDSKDYQTVYSKVKGSVAAPTAGLHFTESVLSDIRSRGIDIEELTLHVGAGTFQPVKSEDIGSHPMHTEVFTISRTLLQKLIKALEKGTEITAIGTTSVRTLESLPWLGEIAAHNPDAELHVRQWQPYEDTNGISTINALRALEALMDSRNTDRLTASTAIMIAPTYNWRIVNHIVTNFHQPHSTLLLLVASFLGKEGGDADSWRTMYTAALDNDYKFLSYGDSCYLQ